MTDENYTLYRFKRDYSPSGTKQGANNPFGITEDEIEEPHFGMHISPNLQYSKTEGHFGAKEEVGHPMEISDFRSNPFYSIGSEHGFEHLPEIMNAPHQRNTSKWACH